VIVKVLGLASCGEDLWGFTCVILSLFGIFLDMFIDKVPNKFDMKIGFEN
jgi:hypothetical protein